MELVQLVYHSRPAIAEQGSIRLETFRAIHKSSVARNRTSDIGGFLVLTNSHFVQLLEGERSAVTATFDRIRHDPRHTHVTVCDILPCRTRAFADWSMGAIHDEMSIREAMLSAGISSEQPIPQLSARQIVSVFGALAAQTKRRAA